MKKCMRILALALTLIIGLAILVGCNFGECQHEGGVASCTEKAVCEKCGEAYGEALGHDMVIDAAKAPTCTETGLTEGSHCSRCDHKVAQEVVGKLDHKDADKNYVCDDCEIELCTTHTPAEAVKENEVAPKCDVAGSYDSVVYCANCGKEISREKQTVAKLEHSYDEGVVTTAPTCEGKGVKTFTCQREGCGHTYTVDVDPIGHAYSEIVVPSTCITVGYTEHVCGNCGDSYKDSEQPLAEHKYVGVQTKAPTCTETGTMTYTCSVEGCNDSYTDNIPEEGHKEVAHEGKAATCEADGWEAYVTCENCDYTTYQKIDATGHSGGRATCTALPVCENCGKPYGNYDLVNGHDYGAADCEHPATCELCGATSGSAIGHTDVNPVDHKCDRCQKEISEHVDANKDHKCDNGCSVVLGTCEDKNLDHKCDYGCLKAYGTCEDKNKDHVCDYGCSKAFGEHKDGDDKNHTCDYGCNKPVEGEICVDVNPKNHVCDECGAKVGGECVDSNDKDHLCDYCGRKIEECYGGEATCTHKAVCVECGQEYGAKLPHVYDQYNAVEDALKSAATCTASARYYFSCSCGDINRAEGAETFEYSDPLGHSYKAVVTAPTCLAEGYTTHTCHCGDSYITDKVPALGHDMATDNAVPPTCTETGLTEGSHCTRCDHKVPQNVVDALGHTEVVDAAKDPSCTETGLTEGKHCSVCNEILVAQVVLPKAHSFVGGECMSCGAIENIFAGNAFTPAESAIPSILTASWWKGSGYEGLTDGIKNADNAPGRFATVMKTSGMMDATMNLGGAYLLDTIRFYTYDPAKETSAGSLGTDLLIQVYSKGEWVDVITCADNAAIVSHLVVNDGAYDDYLEFDLGGIRGEKIRFYISASASASGTSYEEIECTAMVAPHEHTWVDATCAAPKTCSSCGATEGEALPHTEVIDAAVASTCTSIGLTEGKHCSVCNAVLVAQEVIPMHNLADGVCVDCGYAPNVFAGKEFVPTEEAKASILSASWWQGSGYKGLTDGIRNADNAPGRFSTVMSLAGMMDATINLGGTYELYNIRFYTYDPNATTGAGSLGSSLLIQVSSNGEWIDVVTCADNAAIASHLVVNGGAYDDYLEFDLGGIKAEKVRFYISASASGSGTTYEEIACDAKKYVHVHSWADATCTEPKTCSTCGEREGNSLGHNYVDSVCSRCGYVRELIANVFTGKVFVPTEGAAAGNQYNVNTHGYDKLTDGIYNKETTGRYSGKSTAGVIVEATLDLGSAYELSEFTIYMYKNGLNAFGTELIIQVLTPEGEWVTVVHCKSNAELTEHIVAKSGDEAGDKLVFDLGSVSATQIRFTMPAGTTSKYPSMHEIICSGYAK